MGNRVYVHSGHKKFDKCFFRPIKNWEYFVKPLGGLWASPISSLYGWEQWCKDNHFNELIGDNKYCGKNKFYFKLKDDVKLLYIDSVSKLQDLPKLENKLFEHCKPYVNLDFEELAKMYDAIEVSISSDYDLYYALYGWDVDSILIMNPDSIEVIEGIKNVKD